MYFIKSSFSSFLLSHQKNRWKNSSDPICFLKHQTLNYIQIKKYIFIQILLYTFTAYLSATQYFHIHFYFYSDSLLNNLCEKTHVNPYTEPSISQDHSLETDSVHVGCTSVSWGRRHYSRIYTSAEKSYLEAAPVNHFFMEYKQHRSFYGQD